MPFLLNVTPNWREGVEETVKFATQIARTGAGREVREARRPSPVWSFAFKIMVTRETHRMLAWFLRSQREAELYLPAPTLTARLSADLGAADSFVPLSAVPWWATVGTIVVLGGVLHRITAVSSGGVTVQPFTLDEDGNEVVAGTLTDEFGYPLTSEGGASLLLSAGRPKLLAGARLRLALRGRLSEAQSVKFETAAAGQASLEFEVAFDQAAPYAALAPTPPIPTFLGLPLCDLAVNWREGVEVSYEVPRSVIALESGPTAFFWETEETTKRWSFLHTSGTGALGHRMLHFFCARRGRCQTFYFAGPASELAAAADLPAGSTSLKVVGNEQTIADALAQHSQYLMIRAPGGAYMRRLVSVDQPGDGTATLFLADPIPESLTAKQIRGIRPINQCRFADDTLKVTWQTEAVAETPMSVRTTDYLEPDDYLDPTGGLDPAERQLLTENSDSISTLVYSGTETLDLGGCILVFPKVPGLAWTVGTRLRMTATGDTGRFMEGVIGTYTYNYGIAGMSMVNLTIDTVSGAGSASSWVISPVPAPTYVLMTQSDLDLLVI